MPTHTREAAIEAGLLNRRQVAEVWGLSKRSTDRALAAGAVPPVYIPGLTRPKYRRVDVEKLVRDGRAAP